MKMGTGTNAVHDNQHCWSCQVINEDAAAAVDA
jgi:hypothetical protein